MLKANSLSYVSEKYSNAMRCDATKISKRVGTHLPIRVKGDA